MAGSEQKAGLVGRVKGKLHARKERSAERARLAGELRRAREQRPRSKRNPFEGGGG